MADRNNLQQRAAATQRVAIVGAAVNLLLSVVKLLVGFIGQSQSLIADGLHSLSDLASDLLVWWVARHARHGPDEEHPYGHGRFETAGTLALGALLVLVAGGIIWDAFERLLHPETLFTPKPIALYAALFSILANEGLYWYTIKVSRRINSELLRANAWHHRTDSISSLVVLVGIGGALFGFTYLDAIAAIAVGLMIAKIGWDLGQNAMLELVDTGLDEQEVQSVRDAITGIAGVRSLHMLRTRKLGHEVSADVHVQVDPHLSVSEGHMISLAVEQRLRGEFDEINDVTVHIDPEDDESVPPCVGLPMREQALDQLAEAWAGVPCVEPGERVTLHYLSGAIDIDLRLPLDCYQGEAHRRELVEQLQKRLSDWPYYRDLRILFE